MRTFTLSLLLAAWTLPAGAVAPNLTGTTPPGGQRGTELEVTFRGDRLDDTQDILFYHPGIHLVKLEHITNNAVRARLKIDPDCRLGEHALRVRTASGISPLRMFHVGAYPSVEEKEPNNDRSQAQPIPLGVTVSGTLGSEDMDNFVVEAKKGQRISVEAEGARLGRTMLDPRIAIFSESGQRLLVADDNPLFVQDPFATLLAPEDGKYFIEIRDSAYAGSGHVYRLHVGSFPRPAAVYPPGGQTGDTLEVRFLGDPTGPLAQKVKLPAEPHPQFSAVADDSGLAPSPNWMRVSPFPNVLEVEPNNDRTTATASALELPLAFNGVLQEPGDADWFRFKAGKDQQLDLTVYARRLGSPVDSVLTLFDATGRQLASNDDAGGPDSFLRFRVPADGEYLARVHDQFRRGGDTCTYRLEIEETRPRVTLFVPDAARYDYETRKSIVVPRGNRFAFLMNATRENFNGELKLLFDGLPEGITWRTGTLAAGQNSIPVVFEAAADAPIAGKLIEPVALATDPAQPVRSTFRHRVEWVRIQNNTVYVQSDVHQMAAAVAEPLPFRVSLVEPQAPLVRDGAMDLEVVAERDADFDGPITVRMLFNPPGVGSLPEIVIPKDKDRGIYRLNANNNAQTGKWPLVVVATATVKGGAAWVSSQLATLEVAPPYLAGKIQMTTVERGQKVKVVCDLEQQNPFDGKVTVKLLGLPAHAAAAEREITSQDKQVVFEVSTNDKTQLGMHRNLFCSAVIVQNGQRVEQALARGGVLRVDSPRARTVATAAAAQPAAASDSAK